MAIVSKDWFSIDGIKSTDIGVYVDTPPVRPMAEAETEEYQTGLMESIVYPTGSYKDITISISCYTFEKKFDPSDFYTFVKSGDTLILSNNEEKCYKIKQVAGIMPSYSGYGKNKYTVSFQCSPFVYNATESYLDYTGDRQIMTVNGNVNCYPTIRFECRSSEATGDKSYIIVKSNGNTLYVYGIAVDDSVVIDCEHKVAYTTDGGILKTSGIFPTFVPGNQTLNMGSDVTHGTFWVKLNERWL
jgi:phage-related protein